MWMWSYKYDYFRTIYEDLPIIIYNNISMYVFTPNRYKTLYNPMNLWLTYYKSTCVSYQTLFIPYFYLPLNKNNFNYMHYTGWNKIEEDTNNLRIRWQVHYICYFLFFVYDHQCISGYLGPIPYILVVDIGWSTCNYIN